jgi:hypothetical protein
MLYKKSLCKKIFKLSIPSAECGDDLFKKCWWQQLLEVKVGYKRYA